MKRGARTGGEEMRVFAAEGGEGRETRAHLHFVDKVRVGGQDLNKVHIFGEQIRRPADSSKVMCATDE